MKSISILLLLLYLGGCVAIQPFPLAARAGDTITLALGSNDDLNRSNLQLTYIPTATASDPNTYTDLTPSIRSIFKLYPDKRSTVWTNSTATGIPFTGGHGAWLDVVVLDLPLSLAADVGAGAVRVNTTSGYHQFGLGPDGKEIAMEILPGTGESNNFDYMNFSNPGGPPLSGNVAMLQPIAHYLIKPDYNNSTIFNAAAFAAAEITLTGTLKTISEPEANRDANLRVIPDDMYVTVDSQKQVSWSRNDGVIKINVISPTASLKYYETMMSVFFQFSYYGYEATPAVSIKYYDADGYEVTGPPVNIYNCDTTSGCV